MFVYSDCNMFSWGFHSVEILFLFFSTTKNRIKIVFRENVDFDFWFATDKFQLWTNGAIYCPKLDLVKLQIWHIFSRLNVTAETSDPLHIVFIKHSTLLSKIVSNFIILVRNEFVKQLIVIIAGKTDWNQFMFYSLCKTFNRMSFYAVAHGRSVGIFNTW